MVNLADILSSLDKNTVNVNNGGNKQAQLSKLNQTIHSRGSIIIALFIGFLKVFSDRSAYLELVVTNYRNPLHSKTQPSGKPKVSE